jgi:hypothetical protein
MANFYGNMGWRSAARSGFGILLLLLPLAQAADPAKDLVNAVQKGNAAQVRTLLAAGAPVDARDKKGRSVLELAARGEHADVLSVLLEHSGRPVPMRVALAPSVSPENLYSSCFTSPQQLVQQIAALRPQAMEAEALSETAATAGKGLVQWSGPDAPGPVLQVRVRPSISCVQQRSGDSISMAIDVRLVMKEGEKPVFEKTYGGGLKGLHSRTATSAAQYPGLLREWAREHAGAIFWDATAALVKVPQR